ncbi:MAG: hypothetical protein A2V98_01875 [Planctomycetes bacterium RBG_16_64_12]|nr:MAG: hypothetical protein A2V98_01875 [Planctomycetes bacterium RBG_16_64_12]
MPVETEIIPFLQWLPGAVLYWLLAVVILTVAASLLGLLVAAVEYGPWAAVGKTWRVVTAGVADVVRISPRRVWALTRLAVKESVRRRVVVVFAVFILVLAFAGLFLDPGNPNPARLYLSFVLTATSYLVLLLALFLSAFSLPTDIRTRTLHTVVTKPVRPSEVVLGRMLGFTIIGTGLLLIMALVSYGFVVQGLGHTHTLTAEDLRSVGQAEGSQPRFQIGKTSQDRRHRHQVMIEASGQGRTDVDQGHWHESSVTGSGTDVRYKVGPPKDMLVARVPVYGSLRFRDPEGIDRPEGINVGDEWSYRGFIQGGSPAALIWSFQDVDERTFPEGLPVEMTIGVFRTHKGVIERGILGSVSLRNPRTGLTVELEVFESKEFATKELTIPRKITKFVASPQVVPRKEETPEGVKFTPQQADLDLSLAERREFDLFEDLVDDGRLEVWVRCLEPGQYFGAAQADLYLRAADAPFVLNFVKGYFGIWLQMVLVIGFGVMFSTFLSGSVAMIATLGALVGGFFSQFMTELARGQVHGGGPLEAATRLVMQENLMSELESGVWTTIMQMADTVLKGGLWVISSILPAFGRFSYTEYVAYGFDISRELLLMRSVNAVAFLLPVFVAAYFFLKIREVAR